MGSIYRTLWGVFQPMVLAKEVRHRHLVLLLSVFQLEAEDALSLADDIQCRFPRPCRLQDAGGQLSSRARPTSFHMFAHSCQGYEV